jgi:hypothetical protein
MSLATGQMPGHSRLQINNKLMTMKSLSRSPRRCAKGSDLLEPQGTDYFRWECFSTLRWRSSFRFCLCFSARSWIALTVFFSVFVCFLTSATRFFSLLVPSFESFSVRWPGFGWLRRSGDRHRERRARTEVERIAWEADAQRRRSTSAGRPEGVCYREAAARRDFRTHGEEHPPVTDQPAKPRSLACARR